MTDFFEAMGTVFYVNLIIGPLVVLYLIIKWAVGSGIRDASKRGVGVQDRTAREILDERYARGEIGREEY
jgi:uncharacterized membrane protein